MHGRKCVRWGGKKIVRRSHLLLLAAAKVVVVVLVGGSLCLAAVSRLDLVLEGDGVGLVLPVVVLLFLTLFGRHGRDQSASCTELAADG